MQHVLLSIPKRMPVAKRKSRSIRLSGLSLLERSGDQIGNDSMCTISAEVDVSRSLTDWDALSRKFDESALIIALA